MSIIGKLFGQKQLLDFSGLRADMHSHLLPGIDDGSVSVDSSVAMMNGLKELGFNKFITTPHIMREVFENTADTIQHAERELRAGWETPESYHLHVAAEYYIDDQFPDRVRSGESFLTFGDHYILVEVSMMGKEKKLEEALFELNLRGLKPVLAHVERYPYMFERNKLEYYAGLRDADVLLQVNIRSFAGNYGEIQKRIARELADADMIAFLGTDIHHESQLSILHQALKDPHLQHLLQRNTLLNNRL